jgi:hypothetical protein
MLDNDKLNRRLKKIFKELKDKWRLTPYRIAVETGIPHSSLKYMVDGRFEWKLNHMLAVVDFLNRYGAKTSLTDLLDFDEKKSLGQILNMDKADFRGALGIIKRGRGKASDKIVAKPIKPIVKETKPVDFKVEVDSLIGEIAEVIKESLLHKNSKIVVGLKINGKDINFQKNLFYSNGKKIK